MCGFVGLAGASLRSEVERVLPLIAHRGPDGQGVYCDAKVTLGHCRLAIIDVPGGQQPFEDPDGRFVLIYNGEIYNYRELGERLRARGVRLRTNSDTEVLAHWLAEFGEAGLPELNGMFAFAFWDRTEERLLLARDRLGIKPLYLAQRGPVLVFGSEIKALLPFLPRCAPNAEALLQFATFQHAISEATLFEGVERLAPGSWLSWSPGGIARGRFWELRQGPAFRGDRAAAQERYLASLEAAVKRQMVSDVPLGSHLSSGLDSSAIATFAARHAAGPLQTFTGAFRDGDYYDERAGSRAVAGAAGAGLHEVEIGEADFLRHFEDVVWHLEEPTLGTGALPQYLVSKLAADHVTVVLTGHGGDELFAGYQVNKVALLSSALRRGLGPLVAALRGVRRDEITRILYYLLYPLAFPEVGNGLFVMTPKRRRASDLAPELLERVNGYEPVEALERHLPDGKGDLATRLFHLYLKTYLPSLLIQEDKVGMAHSLEARIPLCDNELIDLGSSLSLDQKLDGGRLKAVPRGALEGVLPKVLFDMPKRGFPTPFARWFRGPTLRPMVEELLLSKRTAERGVFRPERLAAWLASNRASRTDSLADYALANKIYSASLVEQWFRVFVDGERPTRFANLPTTASFADRLAA